MLHHKHNEPTLRVNPFGFSVSSPMRQLRSSLALIVFPGLPRPAVSGVVVAGLGVLSIGIKEDLLGAALSSATAFPLGGGGGRDDVLLGAGSSGEATKAAFASLAAFALAIAEAVDTTSFCIAVGAEGREGLRTGSNPQKNIGINRL